MKKILSLIFCLLLLLSFSFKRPGASTEMPAKVKTANGFVEGVLEKSGVISFKGIPFAAPPVGEFRWREPQPVKNWDTVLKADRFGPRAMQTAVFGDMNFRSNGMSEDCLYLNIWTPSNKTQRLFPVLVYFYGGGFVAGDGSESRYDGESMAKNGVVSLTVNYRLGAFGFMAHPELTKESPFHASGNYGLLDQAAALKWVKENIQAFGGDPNRITIAGESAGSVSVSAQMASPLSKNLFNAAIGESGSILGTLPATPLSRAEAAGVEFAEKIGAKSLAELRAIPADKLLEEAAKFNSFRFSIVVDGYFLPEDPYTIFSSGKQAQVPLLAGWNNQESSYRSIMGTAPLTKENFETAVRKRFGDKADEILKVYRVNNDAEVEQVATDLAGDSFIGFSTWKWIDEQAKTGKHPVYRYLYSHPRPAMRVSDLTPGLAGGVVKSSGPPPPPDKGAVHSAEIEYAMGNLDGNKVFAWTADDYKVSKILQGYFINFIKTGVPGNRPVEWPAISRNRVPVLNIGVKTKLEDEKQRERFLLMDRLR